MHFNELLLIQMVLLQILNHWGYDGFDRHVDAVTQFYREKKDLCTKAAVKHLTGVIFYPNRSIIFLLNK